MVLSLTLSEEGVAVLHDALACMFKFSDDVCLEANKDKVPPMDDAIVSLQ
jgi:cell cycle checkpoint control protein RAD9A